MSFRSKQFVSKFSEWLNETRLKESEAYDEPETAPTASIRQEDWSSKEKLSQILNTIEELQYFIEDGEQLSEKQIEIISNLFDNVQSLKHEIEGRIQLGKEKDDDLYKNLNNPNL